jgi:hypothetical protein
MYARIDSVIAKNLTDITAADVQELIENSVCETTTLEFKRDLPGAGDDAKREFLADVSALANTAGGDILYGIAEENGCASAISGIAVQNLDNEVLRLGSILNSGLDPRIRFSHVTLPCLAGTVLLLRVEKSWNAPHRIIFRGYDKFFARTGAGKYPLDVQQLRRAFVENNSIAERIRNFRVERFSNIIAGSTPIPLTRGSKLVIHLLPFDAFWSEREFDVRAQIPFNLLQPLNGGAWNSRLTYEGKLVMDVPHEGASCSYLHLYRNGVIEIVDSYILNRRIPSRPDIRYIPSTATENLVVTGVARGLGLIQHLGVSAPIAVTFGLTNVKDMILITSENWDWFEPQPILNDHLFLPEAIMSELTERIGPLLKPLFDLLWNAGGFEESNFDAQGTSRPR